MRRNKKRRIRWGRIFILVFFLFLIIGGSFIFVKSLDKNKKNKTKDKVIEEKKMDDKDEKMNANLEKAPLNYLDFSKLGDGDYITDKGYTLSIKNHVAYIEGNIIVNKTYSVPDSYVPVDSYESVNGERCNKCINKDAMNAFLKMQSDALAMGLNIYISSGYRGYSYQEKLYNNYVSISGKEGADTYSARPGHSEHQTGTCFDLNTVDDSFQYTNEGKWVHENAYLYGFIIRYPKGKESITGYQYESWHLRYVGVDLASKLYSDGNYITLEEYYGISSSYE